MDPFFRLSVLEETEGLEDAVSAILYYQRRKPEEPAYKWNILWYVEMHMLVLFSNSNRLFSHTSGLQVREVEYQNIIYRVHALHCASNKAFCLRKNKQTNKHNNNNHEENSLQQQQSRRKTKQLKKMFFKS